jgi:hypothetical protein
MYFFTQNYVVIKEPRSMPSLIIRGGHVLEHNAKEWWRGYNPWVRLDKKDHVEP